MTLTELRLRNFRNHAESVLECVGGLNVLEGKNGEGKTNVLEAITYLGLTKSFFAAADRVALRLGASAFEVAGSFISDQGAPMNARIVYDASVGEKSFFLGGTLIERLSAAVGQFPVVVLSPEKHAITAGTPADRRKFVDMVISQASSRYLDYVIDYQHALRQRNKILNDALSGRSFPSEALEAWTESLIRYGAQITVRRASFLREFIPHVQQSLADLTGRAEKADITYLSSPSLRGAEELEEVKELTRNELLKREPEERRLATTVVGPHRDEWVFSINGMELRRYASQGQHKTFLVALKLAEFVYLKEQRNELPMLLLDDLFSDLDEHRRRRVLETIQHTGQTFITTTDRYVVENRGSVARPVRRFVVSNGTVTHDQMASIPRQAIG